MRHLLRNGFAVTAGGASSCEPRPSFRTRAKARSSARRCCMAKRKNGPLRGHSRVASVVMMMAFLDDHHLVGVAMAPTFVPAMVTMHHGMRTVAVVMAAALDHHGFCACNRRRCDGDRAKRDDNVAKLPHVCPPP